MAFYNVCPKCGAHLDPNEKCDCENVSEKEVLCMKCALTAGCCGLLVFF